MSSALGRKTGFSEVDGRTLEKSVWSHLQLGKIRDAIETNDNTRGAVDEARKLLQQPYEEPQTP